ncbi:MAG: hypothetical protein DRH90_25380 [Deltaproteobacteria bacterium]|nr:MAG: hypothetical protein DRH90_25380 [Deltaproteobacteria bacterium]
MIDKDKRSKAEIEWENRTLCSDENCIGVIGPDGRCKECGKPFEGEFTPIADDGDFIDAEGEMADAEEDCSEENLDGQGDTDWENRTLCSDESCIGVIGPDGRCKECGKPFVDSDT